MKELCRICVERSNNYYNLFTVQENGITLATMISACTGTKIHETFETCSNICSRCTSLLHSAYEFHNLFESSEIKLKQIVPIVSVDERNGNLTCEIKVEQLQIIELDMIVPEQTSSYSKSSNKRKPDSEQPKDSKKAKLHQKKTTKLNPNTKTKVKKFECYKCKMELSSAWKTIVHLRGHDAQAKYKCLVCSEKYIELADFNWHSCKHSQIQCEYCSEQFDATIALLNHLNEAHDEKRCHRCPKCLQYFEMLLLLEIHLSVHPFCSQEVNETIKEFSCEICSKRFGKNYLLQQHMVIHSDDRRKELKLYSI